MISHEIALWVLPILSASPQVSGYVIGRHSQTLQGTTDSGYNHRRVKVGSISIPMDMERMSWIWTS